MSLFVPVQAKCPVCNTVDAVDLAASVNADRRPDLRAAILDGSFQATPCPNCAAAMRLPAHLTYIDAARRQWLLVEDIARLNDWETVEIDATALFDRSFGPGAPAPQRMLMQGGQARLVFGWAALREKLIAAEAGLDDIGLEVLKISVLRRVPHPPFADGMELRLVGVENDSLDLAWLESASERFVAALKVPLDAYRAIEAEPVPWLPLRNSLSAGLFVDMNRMVLA